MKKLTVLFQGDSITDMDRDRSNIRNMGNGYPLFAASNFRAANPKFPVDFLDLGISGNRVSDLRDRWQSDCLDLHPDVLSVLIGINDTWRRYDSNLISEPEEFERIYRSLLEDARRENPNLKIIIMEPFVLHTSEERASWREDLDPRIMAVRRVAKDYADAYIPLDGIMNAAAIDTCPEQWAADGVHPTPDGAALIASHWLDAFEKVLEEC